MVIFNNHNLSQYVKILDIKREIMPEKAVSLETVLGVGGGYISNVSTGARTISVEFCFIENTKEELRSKARQLASILNTTDLKELRFLDEPNLYYKAIFTGRSEIDEILSFGKGSLEFLIPDGIAYGEDKTIKFSTGSSSVKFSRNSQAFTENEQTAGLNVPRFFTAPHGQGIIIEDAIHNLFPRPHQLEGFNFDTYTISQQLSSIIDGVAVVDFERAEGERGDCRLVSSTIQVPKNKESIFSFELIPQAGTIEIKAVGKATDSFEEGKALGTISSTGDFVGSYGARVIDKQIFSNGWIKYSIALPSDFFSTGSGDTCNFQFWHGWANAGIYKYKFQRPMFYTGVIARNFTPIKTESEQLSLNVSNLNTGGSIEHSFYVGQATLNDESVNRKYISTVYDKDSNELFGLFIFNKKFYISYGDDGYMGELEQGWHTVGLIIKDSKLVPIIDGVEVEGFTVPHIEKIHTLKLGSNDSGLGSNSIHDFIRLSNPNRVASEIIEAYGKEPEEDANTIDLFLFNGSLASTNHSASYVEFDVMGTLETYPNIQIAVGDSVDRLEVVNGSQSIILDYEFRSGDVVDIDCITHNIKINGKNSLKYLDIESEFFKLIPKSNRLLIGGNLQTTVQIKYQERWL